MVVGVSAIALDVSGEEASTDGWHGAVKREPPRTLDWTLFTSRTYFFAQATGDRVVVQQRPSSLIQALPASILVVRTA